jgi:hypothetical protein
MINKVDNITDIYKDKYQKNNDIIKLSNNNNVIPFDSDIIISEYHNIDIVV